MATSTTRKRSSRKTAGEPAATTDYIVLERVERDGEELWRPVTRPVDNASPIPKVFKANGKPGAIRQHTGDGPDVVEGTWRAIPVSSWRGGLTTRRVTASERLPIE